MKHDYVPTIWSEDEIPLEAIDYANCEVCTRKSRIIWGEGNPKASIFIILDNPGEREDKEGNKYVCGTRITLQWALKQVNLTDKEVYLTYLLKCRPTGRYNKEKAREFSRPFLEKQIIKSAPKTIICLGDTVVKTMFNDNNTSVKNLRGKFHKVLGYPAIVSYHPLAVRRRPNLMKLFLEDLEMINMI